MYTRSFWNSTQPGRVGFGTGLWGEDVSHNVYPICAVIVKRLKVVSTESEKEGVWAQLSVSVAVWAICTQKCACSNPKHLKQPYDRHITAGTFQSIQWLCSPNWLSHSECGEFLCPKNCGDRLWDAVVLLYIGYVCLLLHPELKWAGAEAVHLHLVTVSRMRGVVPPPPKTPPWSRA